MKAWHKVIWGIALSLVTCFTTLGYAQLSNTLTVSGEINAAPPNAIYIVDIKNVETSGVTLTTTPTNIDFPSTKVLSNVTFSGRNSYVKFDVSIANHTAVDQIFDVLVEHEGSGETDVFSYAGVKWSVEPGQGTSVPKGETVDFTVTYTYTGTGTNQVRNSLYSFKFVMNSGDLTEIVSKGITDRFADILNNRLEEDVNYTYNGGNYTVSKEGTYSELVEHMETDRTGNYIGNLAGADGDDKALLTALFGGELTFNINDEDIPVTVMVKNKNVYNGNGAEMILYITADDLSAYSTYVPVYAAVFSLDSTGTWVQIGDIFAGEAQTNAYSGWFGSGSFNTESWRSTLSYYGTSVRSSIATLMTAYETATSN